LTVTGVPWGIREERQANDGLFQLGRPSERAARRISALPEAGLEEREAHAALHGGGVPGPVVVRVVGGRAVGEGRQPEALADRFQGVEELLLAVEAAVGVVADVGLQLDLRGVHLDQLGAQPPGELTRLGLLGLRVGGRRGEHRDDAPEQLLERQLEQQRRVDAARVGDQGRAEPADLDASAVEGFRVGALELNHASASNSIRRLPRGRPKARPRASRTRSRNRSAR